MIAIGSYPENFECFADRIYKMCLSREFKSMPTKSTEKHSTVDDSKGC